MQGSVTLILWDPRGLFFFLYARNAPFWLLFFNEADVQCVIEAEREPMI